jgi:tight adherence protein C
MTPTAFGTFLGLVGGLGLATAVLRTPWLRRTRLDDRLAPYLRDAPRPSRLLVTGRAATPLPTLEHLVGPPLRDLVRSIERVVGGSRSLRVRLEQAGLPVDVDAFRIEQVLWGGAGLVAGIATAGVIGERNGYRPIPLALLCLSFAVAGWLARDRWLSHQVARREEAMMAEFPTVAELLALAVAAGEGALGALERVARRSHGELARELGRALADARTGSSLVAALDGVAARTSLPALSRFVDGVAIAVQRGTPLADVLRAQAVDVREAGRRALLESGGRKEIAMMVPVVFLVLPVTVLFALFPGFYGFSFAG